MHREQRFHKIRQVLDRRQPSLTMVMENIRNPNNFAAIVRTCDAVGVQTVHTVAYDDEFHVNRHAASGSQKWVDVVVHQCIGEAFSTLRDGGFRIFTAHPSEDGQDFRAIDYTKPTAIVMGAELSGLSEEATEQADGSIIIPMAGMVESLNVSVATALILFEAQRQRETAGMYSQCQLDQETYETLFFEFAHPTVSDFCKRESIPYPRINEKGEIVESLTGEKGKDEG